MAAALSQVLPPGARVCDAGCGLGGLSLALAPYCRAVVAADLSAEAIRHLEAQPLPPNVEPRRCDVLADTPEEPYDAMVFCFFGRTDDPPPPGGSVLARWRLKRCGRITAFPGGRPPPAGLEELCRALKEKGILYQSRVLELDMGQPFRSLEDAAVFPHTQPGRSGGADPRGPAKPPSAAGRPGISVVFPGERAHRPALVPGLRDTRQRKGEMIP
ncbi:MAG: SAM-dependent methyltransferase [Flavonifractor plautii]